MLGAPELPSNMPATAYTTLVKLPTNAYTNAAVLVAPAVPLSSSTLARFPGLSTGMCSMLPAPGSIPISTSCSLTEAALSSVRPERRSQYLAHASGDKRWTTSSSGITNYKPSAW